MGFGNDSYVTVWEVRPTKSPKIVRGRVSSSKKNRMTDQYETDFSGFIAFCGEACAAKALSLKEKDRIKFLRTNVTSDYNSETKETKYDFWVYDFEMADGTKSARPTQTSNKTPEYTTIEEDYVPF